jgi:hypothetical protein
MNTRNARRNKRRSTHRRRNLKGGVLSPASVLQQFELLPSTTGSLMQGAGFAQQHIGQHGGAAPVGVYGTGVTDHAAAGDASQVQAFQAIGGMSDMAGGKRRASRKSRKSKKAKKTKKSRKAKKASRKSRKTKNRSRKQRGGEYAPAFGDYMTGVVAKGVNAQFNDFTKL